MVLSRTEQKLAFVSVVLFSCIFFPDVFVWAFSVLKIRSICLNLSSINPCSNLLTKESNLVPVYCMWTANCAAQILASRTVETFYDIPQNVKWTDCLFTWKQGLTPTQASELNVTVQSCRSFHAWISYVGLCVYTRWAEKREKYPNC